MLFKLHPLRFSFVAVDPVHFPAGKSANLLRGAFGTILRRLVCAPECTDARTCPVRTTCPYARIFEPSASVGPSGFHDSPRPFVFRATHLDGATVRPGERFHFDLNLFDTRSVMTPYLTTTFAELAHSGLGPGRGRAQLTAVQGANQQPLAISLDPAEAVSRIRVRFVTPVELKSEGEIVTRPEFPVLAARVIDRISKISELYGDGPLQVDHRAMRDEAAHVRLVEYRLGPVAIERRSSRTGQVHDIGGLVGEALYEGDLTKFLPWLKAAAWTGVGRQTVWGKGQIAVS